MFDKYEIIKVNNEEILYLYLNIDYEFSFKELSSNIKDLDKTIKKFIVDNNIVFKGNIVSLIVSGVLVGNIVLNNVNIGNSINTNLENINYVNKEVINKVIDDKIVLNIEKENKEEKLQEKKQEVINNISTVTKEDNIKKGSFTKKATTKVNVSKTINNPKEISTNKSSEQESKKTNGIKDEINYIYITLKRSSGKTEKIELEEYLIGVVGAEMPASFHIETLKCQAIISRTYALKAYYKGNSLKDNESNQSYKSNDELKKIWGSNYNTYYNKIKSAVNITKGMYLSYHGNYIEAVFHSTSNGKTENSSNVWGNNYSYLISVDSPYDKQNPSFIKTKKFTYQEISQLLGFDINIDTEWIIVNKTTGNRVNKITINDKSYTGVNLRNILALRSADFDILKEDDGITFTTRGYGHGVGLSQYGANGYAKNGYSYEKILKHYYPGVILKKL